jgi:hypothetical protein
MMRVGDRIRLRAPREAWYSGYGMNPRHTIGVDETGTVTAVDVPAVRAIRGRPRSYNVARFGEWQCDFQPGEVERIGD